MRKPECSGILALENTSDGHVIGRMRGEAPGNPRSVALAVLS